MFKNYKIKNFFESFRWLKILFSPFTPFKIGLYVGKTQIGTPYFLPRRWVKSKTKPGYQEPVPLKIGFDYCSLGWKTKWDRYDIRHEWNPVYTFVFFGYQIAITIYHKYGSHFWEPWICYEYMTDKKLSKKERIDFCRNKCPQTWTSFHRDGTKETIDYWDLILKNKYK